MKNLLILQVFTALLILLIVMMAIFNQQEKNKKPNEKICLPIELMIDVLENDFGETLQFSSQYTDWEKWNFLSVNVETGTWSWVTVGDDMQACIEQFGEHGIVIEESNKKFFSIQTLEYKN